MARRSPTQEKSRQIGLGLGWTSQIQNRGRGGSKPSHTLDPPSGLFCSVRQLCVTGPVVSTTKALRVVPEEKYEPISSPFWNSPKQPYAASISRSNPESGLPDESKVAGTSSRTAFLVALPGLITASRVPVASNTHGSEGLVRRDVSADPRDRHRDRVAELDTIVRDERDGRRVVHSGVGDIANRSATSNRNLGVAGVGSACASKNESCQSNPHCARTFGPLHVMFFSELISEIDAMPTPAVPGAQPTVSSPGSPLKEPSQKRFPDCRYAVPMPNDPPLTTPQGPQHGTQIAHLGQIDANRVEHGMNIPDAESRSGRVERVSYARPTPTSIFLSASVVPSLRRCRSRRRWGSSSPRCSSTNRPCHPPELPLHKQSRCRSPDRNRSQLRRN